MKKISIILLLLFNLIGKAQNEKIDSFQLSISPAINVADSTNQKLIKVLKSFLLTKNNSKEENEFWIQEDFKQYNFPYLDIYNIEIGNFGKNSYKPSLMEIVKLEKNNFLLKIGFIGVSPYNNETAVRCIYNIIAIKKNEKWKLKRAIDYQTKDWQTIQKNKIKYILPKDKKINLSEVKKQAKEIKFLCDFFETTPIGITYYSCNNPKQVFEVKGFDYLPNMYYSKTGGMTDYGNIVYSGNNSEYYTHEIVHIYTDNLFPKIKNILDEGIATYFGGSGGKSYTWHKEKLKKYLTESDIDLAKHLNPYERLFIENETSIPYLVGALICERTLKLYGKEKLFTLFKSDEDIWLTLKEVGLTKENFTKQIKLELELE